MTPTDDSRTALLSVVIPVYNESGSWRELVARVEAVDLGPVARQIVLVDDGSTDGTRAQLEDFQRERRRSGPTCGEAPGCEPVKVLFHQRNCGKGAALRSGFALADGRIVIIQDADLEYDPSDYPMLIAPILAGRADVVYGSRFKRPGGQRGNWKNYLANRFLTCLSNLTTGLRLTDMETCYKVFRREILRRVRVEQDRFGFEPEITAKVARLGVRICELPIRYYARTAAEGKKIRFRDALEAVWCILKYGLLGTPY